MSTVQVAGCEIAYRESSGTGRPLVLVHGNSSSSATWQALLDGPLGERYRCVALDLPGHGASGLAPDADGYSLPGYTTLVAEFAGSVGAHEPVLVGWSLGGHIALEAVPALPDVAGLVVFGTPPVASPADLGIAFLPNPAMGVGFAAEVDEAAARGYAASSLRPGSPVPLQPFVDDILATAGEARAGLAASFPAGRYVDEVAILGALTIPIAILHGREEQLVSLDHIAGLTAPTLWRGAVQVIDGAGHSPHHETPEAFTDLLSQFLLELPARR
jgi:pimeloyl-ACP methyl ester carboxylesterase